MPIQGGGGAEGGKGGISPVLRSLRSLIVQFQGIQQIVRESSWRQ